MRCLLKLIILLSVGFFSVSECRGEGIKHYEMLSFTLTNNIPHLASVWTNLHVSNCAMTTVTSLHARAKSQYAKVAQRDGSGYWVYQPEGNSEFRGVLPSSFSSLSDTLAICELEKLIYTNKRSSWLTVEAQYEINVNGTNAIVYLFGDHRQRAFALWSTAILFSDGSIEKNEFISGDLENSWRWFYPKNLEGLSTNPATSKNYQGKDSGMLLKRYFVQHTPLCFIQMIVDQDGRLAGNGICLSQTELYGAKVGLEIALNEKSDVINAIKIYDGERGVVAAWDCKKKPIRKLSASAVSGDGKSPDLKNKIQAVFAKGYAGRITAKPLCLFKTLADGRIDTSFSVVPNLEGQPYSYGMQVVFSKDGLNVEKIEVYQDGEVVALWNKKREVNRKCKGEE